jgi:hypothetical protein
MLSFHLVEEDPLIAVNQRRRSTQATLIETGALLHLDINAKQHGDDHRHVGGHNRHRAEAASLSINDRTDTHNRQRSKRRPPAPAGGRHGVLGIGWRLSASLGGEHRQHIPSVPGVGEPLRRSVPTALVQVDNKQARFTGRDPNVVRGVTPQR